jgi:dihydroflavonol-4-reductase
MAGVLVTGGSGFLGLHTVLQLLERGERVRTTVRSPAREAAVRDALWRAGADAGDRLSFAFADLLGDEGWAEAMEGVGQVLHVASPFPSSAPDHEDELIVPAREGTLRVLRAARDAEVDRVVVTSSFAAVAYGVDRPAGYVYTEDDWTDPASDISAYLKSKTIAERAAWDFAAREGDGLELATICPTAIFGPPLGTELSSSVGLLEKLVGGGMAAGMPRLSFGVVDVRDVAALHLRAMDAPAAAGQRFIATSGDALWLSDAARILRDRLGTTAPGIPEDEIPDDAIRAAAVDDPSLDSIAREVGRLRHMSAAKARRLLGWEPRPVEETLVATAESLLRLDPTA